MKRFLLHVLQVVFTIVTFTLPVLLAGLAITCFINHKIILGVAFSIASFVFLCIATYDW